MASYILLDLNGTVGTDFPDILEKLENPDNMGPTLVVERN